jgi:hypothetical protein
LLGSEVPVLGMRQKKTPENTPRRSPDRHGEVAHHGDMALGHRSPGAEARILPYIGEPHRPLLVEGMGQERSRPRTGGGPEGIAGRTRECQEFVPVTSLSFDDEEGSMRRARVFTRFVGEELEQPFLVELASQRGADLLGLFRLAQEEILDRQRGELRELNK